MHAQIPGFSLTLTNPLIVAGIFIIAERLFDDRHHVLKVKMPCLLTALSELNEPRYMTPGGIFDAFKAPVTVWGRADLKDTLDSDLGKAGSPTQIARASEKVRKGAGTLHVAEDGSEGAEYILAKLKEKFII